jgi:hypothetical protein
MDASLPVPLYDIFGVFDPTETDSDMMRNRSSSSLSSGSIESNASTVDTEVMTQSQTLYGADLVLDAYCLVNGWMVRIHYPDPSKGWVFRYDVSGHAQMRWDYQSSLMLLLRHSTCMKALVSRHPCRNCEMKDIWRRECADPCNSFYIQSLNEPKACLVALQKIILDAEKATPETIAIRMAGAPKINNNRKRSSIDESRKRYMMKQEQKLIMHLLNKRSSTSIMADVSMIDINEDHSLMSMLGHALGLDEDACGQNGARVEESGIVAIGEEAKEYLDTFDMQDESAPLTPMEQILAGYEMLMGAFATTTSISVSTSFFTNILDKYNLMHMSVVQAMANDVLNQLLCKMLLDVASPLLLVKSLFPTWLVRVRAADDETVCLRLGFYTAPSSSIYNEMLHSRVLPEFLVRGSHHIESNHSVAKALAPTGVKPVLVIVRTAEGGLLARGLDILPLTSL